MTDRELLNIFILALYNDELIVVIQLNILDDDTFKEELIDTLLLNIVLENTFYKEFIVVFCNIPLFAFNKELIET